MTTQAQKLARAEARMWARWHASRASGSRAAVLRFQRAARVRDLRRNQAGSGVL